ncbi:hypothetical protein [Paraburkholderia sp. DHOC27]|uniref:hypothetical protein n=1 Tax=Paraburkholderia sp. DHOC27 TaxID=2303330 RepID=UPI000E3CF831|nr:hypothetical protein [Paraburkholderia sp. DHOC27]RFU49624.1 hypothetical protein D0B32_07545 [Paraburkholderia sp. DHOC27]
MTRDEFESKLAMILQDVAFGTTADLTDEAVAYWDGHRIVYATLAEDGGRVDREFDLGARWPEWRAWLEAWMSEPTFSVRPELQAVHDAASTPPGRGR